MELAYPQIISITVIACKFFLSMINNQYWNSRNCAHSASKSFKDLDQDKEAITG